MSASERLAHEKDIMRQLRVALSSLSTIRASAAHHRKGVVYASTALTTGPLVYQVMEELGFASTTEFKQQDPEKFRQLVMLRNIQQGRLFAKKLADNGWRMVIEPGEFFADGWTQEHYMSLWRRVIIEMASTIAFNSNIYWSTGGVEELLIGVQHKKRLLDAKLRPLDIDAEVKEIEAVIDNIDARGFDAKPLYVSWRELTLTLEAQRRTGQR